MAMNREQRRLMRKAGEIDAEGEPVRERRRTPPTPPPRTKEERTTARQFLREVRGELRKVAWPTRSETINYSIIVLVTVVMFTALIFAVDWVFARAVLRIFET